MNKISALILVLLVAAPAHAWYPGQGLPNQVLRMPNSGSKITYGAVKLDSANAVTAVLPISNGGSGALTLDQSYEMRNVGLFANTTTNTLVMALKTKTGGDPSSSSPVYIGFRSSTLTLGQYQQVAITAAPSTLTISNGSTLGHTSTVAHAVYVYGLYTGSAFKLAASSNNGFDEGLLHTTVAEGGAGAADSETALYADAVYSNVPIRLLGRLMSTQPTAGTWTVDPTSMSLTPFDNLHPVRSQVSLAIPLGHGSSSTKIRRFTSTVVNTGTAITYGGNSATLGSVLTINEDGLYSISYSDLSSLGAAHIGISLNSDQLATSITLQSDVNEMVAIDASPLAQTFGNASATLFLKAGDVIRPHTDGSPDSTGGGSSFKIVKVD